jgi:outer membrane protein insertion porin family
MGRWERWPLVEAVGFALALLAVRGDAAPDDADGAPVVERVEILRNQYLPAETLLFHVSTKPGDRYDELRLKQDFRRLWDTGFLDDLLLDVQDGPRGKLVRLVVQERKRVQIVDFRGSKALTSAAIEDRLKEKDAAIRIDSFYDPGRTRRAERVIRDLLSEKGRHFGSVRHEAKNVGGAGVQVSFVVEDGPRTKVREIDFVGNDALSDGSLRGAMKTKEAGFWNLSWLTGRAIYTDERWNGGRDDPGDAARLRDFYLRRGYVTARIDPPRVSYTDGRSGLLRKRPVKWARIEVPVAEGERYRLGEVKLEGLTVFKEDVVRPLFKLRTGDVYDESKITKGYEKLRDAYGAQGYFQWTGSTRHVTHPERRVVDVILAMDEDRRYHVGRIRFVGNDRTRDKVIRREVYLNEGGIFDTEALKLSIRRLNQLGYFKPLEGPPQLSPSDRDDQKIDITFKLEEQNRNQFTLGGGVSGLEGTFFNGSFQTANFLGLGETLSLAAQAGARTRNYQVSLLEPYFLDRPISAGLELYSRRLDYDASDQKLGYSEVRTGSSLTSGLPLGRFTRLFTNYTYEVIDTAVRDDLREGFGPFADEGRNQESRVSPSVVHNTVDNPYTPRRGFRVTASAQVAGGPLGGTVDYLRPELELVGYLPHTRRTALGVRGQAAWIRPFGDTEQLPYYQRFFLGGETQIRGVDVRTVSPFDAQGRALGGNKFVLFNAEYYVDLAAPLRFVLFFDAGEAYRENQPVNLRTLRTSTGAELRFLMPVLNVPFRLIYAYNANRDASQPTTAFKFAVGTTF